MYITFVYVFISEALAWQLDEQHSRLLAEFHGKLGAVHVHVPGGGSRPGPRGFRGASFSSARSSLLVIILRVPDTLTGLVSKAQSASTRSGVLDTDGSGVAQGIASCRIVL